MSDVKETARQIKSINNYFDDIQVGDWFTSRARTITETDLVMFSGLSGDYSSIHIDEEAAKDSPFGARIAHGCLTLSIATGFEFQMQAGELESRVIAFYGLDKVRFTKPVLIGDTLHLEGEIAELQDKGAKGGVVTMRQRIVNQRGDTVASFEKRTLNAKRILA
jgi:3-hydroxybutyryl-CoA dehydratase